MYIYMRCSPLRSRVVQKKKHNLVPLYIYLVAGPDLLPLYNVKRMSMSWCVL